jgi:hypothetical protein
LEVPSEVETPDLTDKIRGINYSEFSKKEKFCLGSINPDNILAIKQLFDAFHEICSELLFKENYDVVGIKNTNYEGPCFEVKNAESDFIIPRKEPYPVWTIDEALGFVTSVPSAESSVQ